LGTGAPDAYLLRPEARPSAVSKDERLTVLEQIELDVLPDTIRRAMIDSKVAAESDFGNLTSVYSYQLRELIDSVRESMKKEWQTREIYDDGLMKLYDAQVTNVLKEKAPL
jgi:hypothetical protein